MCDSGLFRNIKLYIAEELLENINIDRVFSKFIDYDIYITTYDIEKQKKIRHINISGYVNKVFDFE